MQIVIHSYNKLDHMFSHCFYTNNGFGLSQDSTTLIFDSDKRVRTEFDEPVRLFDVCKMIP